DRLQARQLRDRVRPAVRCRAALIVAVVAALAGAAHAQTSAPPPKAEACAACHGPEGNSTQPLVPVLAGQTSRYLYLQLKDFQEGRRSNEQMTPMVAGLSRDDLREIADWFSQQKPTPQSFKADPEKARLGKLKADET